MPANYNADETRPLLTSNNDDSHHEGQQDSFSSTPLLTIHHEGESHRSGFHPAHFLRITWRSSCPVSKYVNLLWPFVLIAIILKLAAPTAHLWVFATAYIAMVPAANLVGFAGQELARKMPKVAGILIETAFGGVVEIVLFLVLIAKHRSPHQHGEHGGDGDADEGNLVPVIQAAILGSILTNLLLCLGLCFFFGGLRQQTQTFHEAVSEVGSGLLLVAGFGLLIPSAFFSALKSETVALRTPEGFTVYAAKFTKDRLVSDVQRISQATSVILMLSFVVYIWYNARSQHSIFDEVLEADEHNDADHAEDLAKAKYTFTECCIALAISLALVTLLAYILVEEIEEVVASGVRKYSATLSPHLRGRSNASGTCPQTKRSSANLLPSRPIPRPSPAPSRGKSRRAPDLDRRSLGRANELRPLPLPWTLHSDGPLQRTPRRARRLGPRQAGYGPQL